MPTKEPPTHSITWDSCTPTARACRRTMPKPCVGSGWLPNRVIAAAQLNLGNMYADGQGVFKDDFEAVKWYRLAAEQGLAIAQHRDRVRQVRVSSRTMPNQPREHV